MQPRRVIAVDWSGARAGHERKVWLAEVAGGSVRRLENGRTRETVTAELVAIARSAASAGERVVIGLDFGFGFPAWYLDARGWVEGADAWRAFTADAVDALLAAPAFPFWGRPPAARRPAGLVEGSATPPWRETERTLASVARPFSLFQLVGAGAVGVASLRGMATLAALADAGATIWPFTDDAGGAGAVVAEIWPRLAAPAVNKSSAAARAASVATLAERVACAPAQRAAAVASDDAFDALSAAAWLWARRTALVRLPADSTDAERREGRILGARD